MDGSMMARICVTCCSHKAERSNELSYEAGDLITVASELMEDREHYQAVASDGSMGVVHRGSFLSRPPVPLHPMPWFHGAISRGEAESLLDKGTQGQFILRTSQNTTGVCALAMSCEGKVNHYLVAMDSSEKLTINGEQYFENLPQLVKIYSEKRGPLGCVLSHPLVRKEILEFYIDQESLRRNWALPKPEVELGETLGRGEFGEVCTATYRGMQVAAKVIHEDKLNASNASSFLQEAAILTRLQHKNLVQLVGVVFQGSSMKCILTELMGKGSLQKYLISRGRAVITQVELLSFARDVCEGMVYISSQGFIHRDLAARNVLLNSNGQAKISDFGLARRAELHVPHEGGKFPVKWTAPEALKDSKFSVHSDVWSFGVLLWEIYSYGRTPYPSVPTSEVLENIEDGIIMDPPDHCPDEIYDLMCVCWELEPGRRPSFPSIQVQLAQATQSSGGMPTSSSPIVMRKSTGVPNASELLHSPVAVQAYKEAPVSRKATMFLGSVVLIGPQGSGKTSLLRSLAGEMFRLVEPPSRSIEITSGYSLLKDNLNWLPSTSGLVYEDELVRIIVEDLLQHVFSSMKRPSSASGVTMNTADTTHPRLGSFGEDDAPPLPPPRRRTQSFSEIREHMLTTSSDDLHSGEGRLSGSFEMIETPSEDGESNFHRPRNLHFAKRRKNLLAKFLNRSFRHHNSTKGKQKVQRHFSDSAKHIHHTSSLATASSHPTTPSSASKTLPQLSKPLPQLSPLPERITEKIKQELDTCSGNTLPPKYLARLIDTPGNPSFRILQTIFLTDNSLCLLVFDASKDLLSLSSHTPSQTTKQKPSPEPKQNGYDPQSSPFEDTYLFQIMAELSNICKQWSGSKTDLSLSGPRIIVVGTHSDKVPSSVTHRNFDILQDEIESSLFRKYVASVKFIVSNSSIIERSSMDDLKHFIRENIKRSCRQQVPLKWLRCVRRFQGFLRKRSYFVSLADAQKLISEICDIPPGDPEISDVIEFLHQNQVIMHFPHVFHLKDLVISSAQWYSQQVSAVFSAASIDLPPEADHLVPDQELLRSRGVLSSQLLDHVWRDRDVQARKDQILTVMHKMDLLCCLTAETQPLLFSASVEDLTADVKTTKTTKRAARRMPSATVLSLVVPALVEEASPPHLPSLPTYDVEPILFRFKDHVPAGLFPRLLVRCVQSYPKGFSLYQHCATFEVDENSIILLSEGQDSITLTLHPVQKTADSSTFNSNGTHPSSSSFAPFQYHRSKTPPSPSALGHNLPEFNGIFLDSNSSLFSPSPDTCMAILMFVQTSINDLIQQWSPHLEVYLCVKCNCKLQPIPMDAVVDIDAARAEKTHGSPVKSWEAQGKSKHYIILNNVDRLVQQLSLRCEHGNQMPLTASLLCWFGEVPAVSSATSSLSPTSPAGDRDYVTDEDISVVCKSLGQSWKQLGQTLGFSQMELECFSLEVPHTTPKAYAHTGRKLLGEWQTLHNKHATFSALLGALEIVHRKDIVDELVSARMGTVSL